MAIALVIAGLIAGSVVVGRSMVRQAQLRDAMSEYDMYGKAIQEFQQKYLALPGDMSNATSIWGVGVTANGDGGGTIGGCLVDNKPANTAGSGGIANSGEWYLAWQQLALAGFIPGNYTGTSADGVTAVIGSNVPASKLSGAGWTINYYLNANNNAGGLWPSNPSTLSNPYGHVLNLGGYVSGSYTTGAILTPAEAESIDQKLDDGMPGTGTIRAWRTNVSGMGNCTINDTSQTAQAYNSAFSGYACSLVFLLGF